MKQKLKQILINKCHRIYEKEVFDKDLSYDRWIREQEKNVENGEEKSDKIDNNLTNDFKMEEYDRDKKENDGDELYLKMTGKMQNMVKIVGW